MPRSSAAARADCSRREQIATTSVSSPRCMAGITLAVAMFAVLRMPQRIFFGWLMDLLKSWFGFSIKVIVCSKKRA